jgi:hypothetical protein
VSSAAEVRPIARGQKVPQWHPSLVRQLVEHRIKTQNHLARLSYSLGKFEAHLLITGILGRDISLIQFSQHNFATEIIECVAICDDAINTFGNFDNINLELIVRRKKFLNPI